MVWAGDGLVGAKTQFPWGTGPAGDAAAFPELYSGLATAGLTPCREPQVFRLASMAVIRSREIRRPMKTRQKYPCFSSNRSTMGSMIDSRKVRMADTAVGSQPGRSTNDTRPRFRPKRALSCPFLAMANQVPVMRDRLGIHCGPDTGLRKWVLGELDVCSSPLPWR